MVLHGHADRLISSIIAGLVLSNTGVALRFLARLVGRLKITIDDYIMLLAMLPYWGMCIASILITQNGLGQPLANIAHDKLVTLSKLVFAETYLYVLTVGLAKFSILAMYWRALPCIWIRRNVYTCGGVIMAWIVAVFIANSLACIPVQRTWNTTTDGKCFSWSAFYYGIQIPNILTDVYIVIVPLRKVFGLNLTRLQKGILLGIFGIAILTIIFDILRLIAMLESNASPQDFTISVIEKSVWTIIEPAVGIFAACLSNLLPLFKEISKHTNFPDSTDRSSPAPTADAQDQPEVEGYDPMSISIDDNTGVDLLSGKIPTKEKTYLYERSISSLG